MLRLQQIAPCHGRVRTNSHPAPRRYPRGFTCALRSAGPEWSARSVPPEHPARVGLWRDFLGRLLTAGYHAVGCFLCGAADQVGDRFAGTADASVKARPCRIGSFTSKGRPDHMCAQKPQRRTGQGAALTRQTLRVTADIRFEAHGTHSVRLVVVYSHSVCRLGDSSLEIQAQYKIVHGGYARL